MISGKLKTEDGLPIANAEAYLREKDVEDGYLMNRYIETDSEEILPKKYRKVRISLITERLSRWRRTYDMLPSR